MRSDKIFDSGKEKLIMEHLYTVENYVTFKVNIKSGEFSGAANFCISEDQIISLVEILSTMNRKLKGNCKFSDYDSDSYFTIQIEEYGHVAIQGQIEGSYEENYMVFKYIAHQTIIINLIIFLKSII